MTVRDFLRRTNNHVKWRLTDRFTRENIDIKKENRSKVLNREIYMFFQDDDGTLNISLF